MVKVVLIILILTTLALYSFNTQTDSSAVIPTTITSSNLTNKICINGIFGLPPPPNLPTFDGLSFSDSDDEVVIGKNMTKYKLVRSQVPLNAKLIHTVRYQPPGGDTIGGKKTAVFFTNGDFIIYNPVQKDPRHPKDREKIYFADHGLSYVVPLDADGQMEIHQDSQDPKLGSFISVDVYQDSAKPDIKPEVFSCVLNIKGKPLAGNLPTAAPISLTDPAQNKSSNQEQLQLEYFGFDQESTNAEGVWSPGCKPAIYLYPKEKTLVNVKVNTKGILTYVDPPYPESGWDSRAYPDGKIEVNGKSYPYLYYESKIPDHLINKPTTGFSVSFQSLKSLYQTLLPQLGLNPIQTQDFINYWEKALPYSAYYFVGVMDQKSINQIEPLEINPKPDYINRVRLYFQALDKKPAITTIPNFSSLNPELITHNQFKVVEWGGMVKTDPLHPFTCSQ